MGTTNFKALCTFCIIFQDVRNNAVIICEDPYLLSDVTFKFFN